jgi:hypothetical protein
MLNAYQATLWGSQITGIYQRLQTGLMCNIIQSIVKRGLHPLDNDYAHLWKLEKMAEMHLLNESNIQMIAKEAGVAEVELRKMVRKLGLTVTKDIDQFLEIDAPLTDVDDRLEALVKQSFLDLNNFVNQTLLTTALGNNPIMRQYEDLLNQAVSIVTTGLKTRDQAIKHVVTQMVNNGVASGFVDKAGRTWSIETYARTVIDSTTSRVFNEMRFQRAAEFGIVTAYMYAHAAARPKCAPIQGGIVLMVPTGDAPEKWQKYPSIYDYSYGTPSGTRGTNCKHDFLPINPDINELPDDPYAHISEAEAIENSKIQAKQRALEREIRRAKTECMVAKSADMPDLAMSANLRVKKYDSALKQLVDGHDWLHRDYSREKRYLDHQLTKAQEMVERKWQKAYNRFNDKLANSILTKAQYNDLMSHDVKRIKQVMSEVVEIDERLRLRKDKQRQHILGTEQYLERVQKDALIGKAPSYFTISEQQIHNLTLKNMNMTRLFTDFQYVNAEDVNGIDVRSGLATDYIKVHHAYGKRKGIHVVPTERKGK